jgi:hypothetical protein
MKHKILAGLLTLSAIATAPAALAQTAPDYAACGWNSVLIPLPDRSEINGRLRGSGIRGSQNARDQRVCVLHD